jgi:hypothetical protein
MGAGGRGGGQGCWGQGITGLRFGVGGVNHCSLHCSLAKFRGLMYRVKYGAVIGLKQPIACIFILGTSKKASFPSKRCICPRTSNHGFSPDDSVKYSG